MPHHGELQEGLASIMRVTDRVNETKRKEDNRQAVLDLSRRVEDWKGHDISSFGELLLQETFFVIKNDSEREYNVYLFERIILCCKESGTSGKKSSKSSSIAKKPQNRRPAALQLKGRIFVNNVTGATPYVRNGAFRAGSAKNADGLTPLVVGSQVNTCSRFDGEATWRKRLSQSSAGRTSC